MTEQPIMSGVDDVHAHPVATGHRMFDPTAALAAIAISVISLFDVAIEHGRTER